MDPCTSPCGPEGHGVSPPLGNPRNKPVFKGSCVHAWCLTVPNANKSWAHLKTLGKKIVGQHHAASYSKDNLLSWTGFPRTKPWSFNYLLPQDHTGLPINMHPLPCYSDDVILVLGPGPWPSDSRSCSPVMSGPIILVKVLCGLLSSRRILEVNTWMKIKVPAGFWLYSYI